MQLDPPAPSSLHREERRALARVAVQPCIGASELDPAGGDNHFRVDRACAVPAKRCHLSGEECTDLGGFRASRRTQQEKEVPSDESSVVIDSRLNGWSCNCISYRPRLACTGGTLMRSTRGLWKMAPSFLSCSSRRRRYAVRERKYKRTV